MRTNSKAITLAWCGLGVGLTLAVSAPAAAETRRTLAQAEVARFGKTLPSTARMGRDGLAWDIQKQTVRTADGAAHRVDGLITAPNSKGAATKTTIITVGDGAWAYVAPERVTPAARAAEPAARLPSGPAKTGAVAGRATGRGVHWPSITDAPINGEEEAAIYRARPDWKRRGIEAIAEQDPSSLRAELVWVRKEAMAKAGGERFLTPDEGKHVEAWRTFKQTPGFRSMSFDDYYFQIAKAQRFAPKPAPARGGVHTAKDAERLIEASDHGSLRRYGTQISSPPGGLEGGVELLRPYARSKGRQELLYWQGGSAFVKCRDYSYTPHGDWNEHWYQLDDRAVGKLLGG